MNKNLNKVVELTEKELKSVNGGIVTDPRVRPVITPGNKNNEAIIKHQKVLPPILSLP